MPETYNKLEITPTKYYQLYLDFLLETADIAIEELDGSLILRSSEDMQDVTDNIKTFTESLKEFSGGDFDVKIESSVEKNEDWIEKYKNSVVPIAVGSFFIKPTWCDEVMIGKNELIIDPSLSFGSGHHESTRGCILALERYITPSKEMLDVGCGSGILAMAGAKLGAVVDICDTDEMAILEAKKNFESNFIEYRDAWVGSANGANKRYDIVVANIIADVLSLIKKDLLNALKEGGILIMSGIIDKRVDSIKERYSELELLECNNDNEWNTIVFRKGA